MATVFSHIHFCPTCNDTWTCVSWVCEEEDGELACQSGRVRDGMNTNQSKRLLKSDQQKDRRDCDK